MALKKVSVNVKLNNGVDDKGSVKTVGISLGTLNVNTFEDSKALAIINLLKACLAKSVYAVEKTELSELAANA